MTSFVNCCARTTYLLAALAVSFSAQAQTDRAPCLSIGNVRSDATSVDTPHYSPYANGCIRDLADGRAAVLLPSALEPLQRVPLDGKPHPHAWGFLDQNGRLAVRPIFEDVHDFRHGLAAVRWQGKWGFINAKGRMAVPPRYDDVSDFAEIGLAVATLDGRKQLIDRQGNAVGDPLDPNIASLVLNDGVPALASMQYKREYHSPTGERRFAPPGVAVLEAYGQGFYIASNHEYRRGLVDRDWNWVVQPVFHDISADRHGRLAVANGPDGSVLLGKDGTVIGAGQHYKSINPVGIKFWSAQLAEDKGYAILGADGQLVATMNLDEAEASRRIGGTILYPAGDTVMALVPGLAEPLPLGEGMVPIIDDSGLVLFQGASSYGLLTPSGAWLHGDSAPAWLAQASRIETREGRFWILDHEHRLLNILEADGTVLLSPDAVEAVQQMLQAPLPSDLPGRPLGILSLGNCRCGLSSAGLLLGDGTLVTDPSWMALRSLDVATKRNGNSAAISPDIEPERLRYAADTQQGVLLLDAQGRPMSLPAQQHIGPFHHGYALVYANGVTQLIDRDGNFYPLPADIFESNVVAPGVISFAKTAHDGATWGLYDFLAGKEIAAPAFHHIGAFENGRAIASLGDDRVGMIDLQGQWKLPARHHAIERVHNTLWKVMQAGEQDEDDMRPKALFNDQGHALTPFLSRLWITQEEDGSFLVDGKHQRWIVSADGAKVQDRQDASYERHGDWFQIRRAPRHGYLNRNGQWEIEPRAGVGSVFQGTPPRALTIDQQGTRLIDAQGKTVAMLGAGDWRWPLGSPWLLKHHGANDHARTDYVDFSGKMRRTVQGVASAYSEDHAVSLLSTGAMRAVNAKGALTGPAFDALGSLSDGQAPARIGSNAGYVDGQGKFVIPPTYKAVSPFMKQRAVASTTKASEIIDPAGRTLARVEPVCGVRTLYGNAGRRLWPTTMPVRCDR